MAPLKQAVPVEFDSLQSWYPCLKGHGPIEARSFAKLVTRYGKYPCLKGHGPIEAEEILSMIEDEGTHIHA